MWHTPAGQSDFRNESNKIRQAFWNKKLCDLADVYWTIRGKHSKCWNFRGAISYGWKWGCCWCFLLRTDWWKSKNWRHNFLFFLWRNARIFCAFRPYRYRLHFWCVPHLFLWTVRRTGKSVERHFICSCRPNTRRQKYDSRWISRYHSCNRSRL